MVFQRYHNGHALTSFDEVVELQAHRDVIDGAVATTAAVRADILESAEEIKLVIKEVEMKRTAAKIKVDAEVRKVMQAAVRQKELLNARVD